jgi:hypothetical protein
MAEDQRPEPGDAHCDEPSLELPSLRSAFRRRPTKEPRPTPAPLVTTPAAPRVEEPTPAAPFPPPKEKRRRRRPIRVHLPGPLAALLGGAVAGLALVGLTSVCLHLCTSWRGTSSCGSPGILLVLAMVGVVAVLGTILLRLLGVPTAAGTSLLGVGLLGVLVLTALLPVVDRWWMAVAVPTLAMLTYVAAWWLTTTYVEPGDRSR